jgi:phage/plasmid primase-like uncharacterized protein/archaellum biogenesis ATPase FlaH
MDNFTLDFQTAMQNAGYEIAENPIPDGKLHRFPHQDKNGSKTGWYVLHGDDLPAGSYGDWRSGQSFTWCARSECDFTIEEKATYGKRIAEQKRIRQAEEKKNRQAAAKRAHQIWEAAQPAAPDHPYFLKKQVKPHGLRQDDEGRLIVPVRDNAGNLKSLQTIDANGKKLFLPGGQKRGCCHALKGYSESIFYLCEGFATAATVHEATGGNVLVCFDAGNLLPVATALRGKHQEARIIICADDDRWTAGNPGVTKATETAACVSGEVIVPQFKALASKPTDFNDLAGVEGIDAVKTQFLKIRMRMQTKKVKGLTMSDLQKKYSAEIEWIWRVHVPKGEPMIWSGREGSGKTTIALNCAQEILQAYPDHMVYWCATEGAVKNTLGKMKEIKIDAQRFMVLMKENGDFKFDFGNNYDLRLLSDAMDSAPLPVVAVYIDSIRGMTSMEDKDDRIGKLMHRLNAIVCDRHGASLQYLHHWNKSKSDDLLNKSTGSTAITAAVRHVLAVVKHSKFARRIKVAKSNISEMCPELEVVKFGSRYAVRELANVSEDTQVDRAENLITEMMADEREVSAVTVYQAAEAAGISESSVKKAKSNLNIKSVKKYGRWHWSWE